MPERRRYRKRTDSFIVAIRLSLDTDGFTYRKWGGIQKAKPGDWIVNNSDDCYTVDGETFSRTYRRVGPGTYLKTRPVWAEVATESGHVATLEGTSDYAPGDYLVSNNEDGSDAYCMSAEKFVAMYEPDE